MNRNCFSFAVINRYRLVWEIFSSISTLSRKLYFSNCNYFFACLAIPTFFENINCIVHTTPSIRDKIGHYYTDGCHFYCSVKRKSFGWKNHSKKSKLIAKFKTIIFSNKTSSYTFEYLTRFEQRPTKFN